MKNHSITVRIDENEYLQLSDLSVSMERSKSYIVEHALKDYLTINAWQMEATKDAIKIADDPKTRWITQESIEAKFAKKQQK